MAILDYRRRRVNVDALEWTGANLPEVVSFLGTAVFSFVGGEVVFVVEDDRYSITPGDYVVRERGAGLLPPCSPEVFVRLYEPRVDAPA